MKTWFITGASRGFGREWTEAALERGDRVAATARNTAALDALVAQYDGAVLPLQLDVTDKAAVDAAVARAIERFGHLDVVVNNAGYGLFGAIEEVSEEEARDQIEANLFGALWVTKAVIPHMRERGSGHIVQVSSIGGINAYANLGLYHASKWGLEGFSQAAALELAPFGVHVTLIEPANYSTDWSGASAVHSTPLDFYQPARDARAARVRPGAVGVPSATREAILAVVDAEQPPLRIFFGRNMIEQATGEYRQRIAGWEAWRPVSEAAHGTGAE
ncbi:SDR family NAD(P)-dependent oxidoreductase [Leucobacter celer]|uniref:SDR family NAD(P)-dependent oxidoreductase n=1 Tax=Leucobacter celer TaxID=668625 RepID=UPI0006A7EFBB|nr:SDR family NAD(P)-dependent oxidoreductase [Leucobacter celer]